MVASVLRQLFYGQTVQCAYVQVPILCQNICCTYLCVHKKIVSSVVLCVCLPVGERRSIHLGLAARPSVRA